MPRPYRLGRRQASVDRTATSILSATRELVAETGRGVTVAAIARRAGVTRVTVYNRFGSLAALLGALAPEHRTDADGLREHLERSCAAWAENPALYRQIRTERTRGEQARRLAERLAATDALRPGCSLREAEDVIAVLSSFAVFDRLHKDGRRSPTAVTEVLMRLASGILA